MDDLLAGWLLMRSTYKCIYFVKRAKENEIRRRWSGDDSHSMAVDVFSFFFINT